MKVRASILGVFALAAGLLLGGGVLTADGTPGAPAALVPSGTAGASFVSFSWTGVSGAEDYQVWVESGPGTVLLQSWHASSAVCTGTGCALRPALALSNGAHTWKVRARNAFGEGPWSSVLSFTVTLLGDVSAGENHTLASTPAGAAWAWGQNDFGALGNGSTNDSSVPVAVTGLSTVAEVAGGEAHSVVLRRDATVWALGAGSSGQLGNGGTADSLVPVQVPGLSGVTAVAAGGRHSLALMADARVFAWGAGESGQLGTGTTSGSTTPVEVPGLTGIVAIAAGASHSLAVRRDGTVWGFGAGASGQLGNGGTSGSLVPVQVSGLTGAVAVASGPAASHSLAVRSDGVLFAWGAGSFGQIGNGTTTDALIPVSVLTGARTAAAGGGHTLAVKTDGTCWAFGDNVHGQLGDGTTTQRLTPVPVSGITGAVDVAAGAAHSVALLSSGQILSWGDGRGGELGDGTARESALPTAISEAGFLWRTATPVASVASGTYSAELAVGITSLTPGATVRYTTSGADPVEADPVLPAGQTVPVSAPLTLKARAWATGFAPSNVAQADYAFQVAAPTITPPSGTYGAPRLVAIATTTPSAEIRYTTDGSEPTTGSPLYTAPFDLAASATVRARAFRTGWTASELSQASYTLTFVGGVAAGSNFSLLLRADGTAWSWGINGNYQLGDGTNIGKRQPVAVSGLSGVVAVAAGKQHALALKGDGSVYAWGDNAAGQIGDGTTTASSTPKLVAALSGFQIISIAAGATHSLAVREDGVLFAWGSNSAGQMGIGSGNPTGSKTPVTVSLGAGAVARAVVAGEYHSLALLADGSARGWGYSSSGQVGNGGTSTVWTPVAVSPLAGAARLGAAWSDSYAVMGDGAGKGWGWAPAVGDGGGVNRTSPVSITTLSGVRGLAGGYDHALAATRSGVYAWGYNGYYQIGDGTPTTRLLPTAIAGPTDVVAVAAGYLHSLALASDGSLFAWGYNAHGQVGDGTAINRSRPVKVVDGGAFMVSTPYFSPDGGSYTYALNVVVTTLTPGSVIRYTTNGNDPTESDQVVASGASVPVGQSLTLKARAFKAGLSPSNVTAATYALTVATPYLSPGGTTYNAPQNVTISCSVAGATIRYTTNGADPTEADTPIASGGQVLVDTPKTLKAKAWKTGWSPSAVAAGTYNLVVGPITMTPAAGAYGAAQTVTLSTATPGATIRYTTTGQQPGPTDPAGTSVLVDRSLTLKAVGFRTGWPSSATSTGSYLISLAAPATPTFSPVGGTYSTPQTVAIQTATPGAIIRYTRDGTEPTASSPLYSSPLTVATSTTLKAKAFKADSAPSATAAAIYALDASSVAPPLLAPAGGTYAAGLRVTVSNQTSGATIRYTTDGSEPAEDDPVIASGDTLVVGQSKRIKARAWKDGLNPSPTAAADYDIRGSVASGFRFSLVLKADGTVWSFGTNENGRLGDGTTTQRSSPVQVLTAAGPLTEVVAIAAGQGHGLAIRRDRTLWAWGWNGWGQIGNGGSTDQARAVQVLTPSGPLTDVVAVAGGGAHSLALKADGTVVSFGYNGNGQLGEGKLVSYRTRAEPVPWLTGVRAIAAGQYHSAALKADGLSAGSLWTWGLNSSGQLADGSTTDRWRPTRVLEGVVEVAAGAAHTLAVLSDGTVAGAGRNDTGQLGLAASANPTTIPTTVPNATGARRASAGERHSLFLLGDGTVWGAGQNSYCELGDGTQSPRSSLVAAEWLEDAVAVAAGQLNASAALTQDGRVWTWGHNASGQLGTGAPLDTYACTPQPIPSFSAADQGWSTADPDADGLTTGEEMAFGSDPLDPDSNDDGISDGVAAATGISLTSLDLDSDGVTNSTELARGTDPFRADTDGDGTLDGPDCFPLDATRSQCVPPDPNDHTAPSITLWEPPSAVPVP